MKLNLVLLALVHQRALCMQQAMDSAELQLALQSKPLDEWLESVAARRQISKEEVRANVQAVRYHLDSNMTHHIDPAGQDPGPAAGGEHARLQRRQPPVADYPMVYGNETLNDDMTKARIYRYHLFCRTNWDQPAYSPYTPPRGVLSFYRGAGGGCRPSGKVRLFCRLPNAYGPRGWRQSLPANGHESAFMCSPGETCGKFNAHNFATTGPVVWGSCVKVEKAEKSGAVNNVPEFVKKVPCPIKPGTSANWDVYGQTSDGGNVEWVFFSGVENQQLMYSRSPSFMFGSRVEWRGTDADLEPWVKFKRLGDPATVEMYSYLK